MNKLKVLTEFKAGRNVHVLEWSDFYTNYKFLLKPKDIIPISGDRNVVYIKMKTLMDFNFTGQKQYKQGKIIPHMTCDKFGNLQYTNVTNMRNYKK